MGNQSPIVSRVNGRAVDEVGPKFENIEENDFCEKPASFEDKVRDVVAPVHRDQ